MKIFLKLKGEETGPYSIETLQGWLKAGHIELNDSAKIDDVKDWIKVKDIPGINEVVSGHLLNDELAPPFEAYRGDDPYIFVSYAHKDSKFVFAELENFHNLGYKVWYDEGIEASSEWPEEIANALIGCKVFLVFISPRSTASVNCRNEINLALNEGKPFLAVHLEESPLPPGLRLRMGDLQAILRYKISEDRYQKKLLNSLDQLLENKKETHSIPISVQEPQTFHTSKSPKTSIHSAEPKSSKKKIYVVLGSAVGVALFLLAWFFAKDSPSEVEIPSLTLTWTDLSNSQTIGSFYGVAIGPDSMVTVGIDGKIATRDHQSANWSITRSGGDPDIRDVIYANGKFVAVGESGLIFTSTSGTTWTSQSSGGTHDLRNIIWDGSEFIIGASNGKILKSSDGTSWTTYSSGSNIVFNAIAFNGNKYIAVGGYGIIHSTDAVNWSAPSSPPPVFSVECAAWTGDKFLVGGLSERIYQSSDGDTWTEAYSDSTGFAESIISQNGKTFVVGGSNFIYEYDNQSENFIDDNTPLDGENHIMDATISGDSIVVVGFNDTVIGKRFVSSKTPSERQDKSAQKTDHINNSIFPK